VPGFRSITHRVRGRDLLVPVAVWVVVVAVAVAALTWGQSAARSTIRDRQQLRTHLGAAFLATQARDVIARERALGQEYLSGTEVTAEDFGHVATSLGFPAAVLVDERGKLLQVTPPAPERLGVDMTTYPHIRHAVTTGRPAVSPVVPSAARGVPVVGFAVPFETPFGWRVFSGGLEIQSSPLGDYLRTAVALPGARQYLVDSAGQLAAAGDPAWLANGTLDGAAPGLAPTVRAGQGAVRLNGEPAYLNATPVRGTPWTLVVVTPESVLYASVARAQRVTRPAFMAMAALGLVAALLVGRARGARRALAEANARFSSLFHGSMLGMALSAPDGRILAVNPALCRLLDQTADELRSRSLTDLMPAADRPAAERRMRHLMEAETPGGSWAGRYVRQDGSTIDTVQSSTLIRDPDDVPLYFATQILDVTERRRLEQGREDAAAQLTSRTAELERMNAELARAHQSVSDLVAMLSHDLRQPLTTIIGYADLALSTWNLADPEEKLRYLTRIKAGSHRAHAMLEETLTLSALDGGQLVTTPTIVRLDDAVADVLSALEGTLPHVDVSKLRPAKVWVDRSHLNQVLINLLSNAVKYGAPPIAVACDQVEDDVVAIHVTDAGGGVAPEFVPHLFERFSRSEAARQGSQKGTGLGLYIVRSLLRANGGDIRYGHEVGGGSRFTILVPVAGPPSTMSQVPSVATSGRSAARQPHGV
jgi:PAS domain S-box-containing protein